MDDSNEYTVEEIKEAYKDFVSDFQYYSIDASHYASLLNLGEEGTMIVIECIRVFKSIEKRLLKRKSNMKKLVRVKQMMLLMEDSHPGYYTRIRNRHLGDDETFKVSRP